MHLLLDKTYKNANLISSIIGDKKYYLFSAHIFSQLLLATNCFNIDNCIGILDNSKQKQGSRLYGTNLTVYDPAIISGDKDPVVVVRCGPYSEEIIRGLRDINKQVVIV